MNYLLTNPQKSIWLTEKVYSGTSINNISGYTYIDEDVEFDVLKKAINEVIKLNDSMRIKIEESKDSCSQYFSEYVSFDIDIFELSSKQDIEKKALELAKIPFEIKNSLLFKFNLFRLPNKHGGFFLSAHHLIGDSWGLGLIVKDILRIYSELKNNAYIQKDSPSYINYINNEKEYINSDKYIKDKAYWDEVFKTVPEVATIPSIKGNNAYSLKSTRDKFIIPDNEINKIKEFCTNNKISVYNFFMAIYSLYLGRVSNLDDFVIGTPILNRINFEQKHTTGMFISTAPLRINLNHDLSFAEFIKQISSNTMSLFRHQRYPYQAILEDLRKKDSNIPNLYNVVLSYQITKTFDEESGIKYSAEWLSNGTCADDLQVHLFDLNDQGSMTVAYEYKTDKYDNENISDLHSRILTIINQVVENKELLLKNIEIVTTEEKHKILYEFNNTKTDYPKNKTIVDLFEEQVEKTPNNVAVVFENQKLTYKELNEKANQLARHLISNNISHKDVVGICLQKGLDFIVSIFATLKCGAIYMPIFTDYPKDRINHMIENSNCDMVITSSDNLDKFEDIVPIDISNFNYDVYSKENLQTKAEVSDVVYIIYTSGSTGKPKGVQITHQNLINFVFAFKNYFNGIDNKDTFFSSTNIAFDVCIWELFTPLLNGAKLVFNTTDIINDIVLFCNNIIKNNVTALYIPPNILNEVHAILNEANYNKISKLLVGVESISNTTLNKYIDLNPDIIIINGYGPTETTICATAFNYKKDTSSTHTVSIGKPLLNNNVYILSKGSLCPIGVPGELYVSGDGVGIGYLNDSKKTSASFVKDIFNPNNKMYSTGDIAYWNAYGTLSFIGRRDKQIKLHGYRIELKEIDCVMETHPIISKSLSIVSNGKIINYFISSEQINFETIKLYLKDKLPFYMIPSFFINIDSFPVTVNGKIDIKALPLPSYPENKYIEPRNEIESILCSIWCKLFNKDKISITDNFFELGGDSLVAIKLQTEALKFNLDINYKAIFEAPTIKELSEYIQTLENNKKTINKTEDKKYYPLSSAQSRIYYSSNLDINSTLYNTAGGLVICKLLDIDKLELCFKTLIKRHDSLRTHFEIIDNEVVQVINDNIDFKLTLDNADTNDLNKISTEFIKPFDLSKAPLFRTKLVKLENNKMLFLLDMHHIISDGTSIGILLQELCNLYNNKELTEKQIDYKDFTLWEKEQFESEEFKSLKEYWVNQFKDEIPLLNMPTTYSRPSVQSFEGSNYHTTLSKEIYNKVNEIAKKLNITPYMLMLSCYYILLSKYTSQEDIVVGTPIICRELPELSNVLGMFVNTLPLKNKVTSSTTFEKFSNLVKENCLKSFKNQHYPFDMLIKDLKITRDTSRNPLFDTIFVYQNNGYPDINFNNSKTEYFIPDNNISKFDLTLEVLPVKNEYHLRFEYCTKLFNEDFIQRFSSHYINILNVVLENNKIKISDIDILSKEEKNQILYDFNNTKVDYPKDKTIVDLFEEQVEKTPNNIAVVFENKKLTYKKLNEKANQLARYLMEQGITNNSIVGIMVPRSLEMIIAMFGILKTGAAYLPVDPTYPKNRIKYILKDSNVNLLLTKSSNISLDNINTIDVTIDTSNIYNTYSNSNLNNIFSSDNLAYVIYTSGSTGNPKGVSITHKNVNNFINGVTEKITFSNVIVSVTTICFDIFVLESILPLQKGITVVITNESEQTVPQLLNKLCIENNATMLQTTPSKFSLLTSDEDSLEFLKNIKILMLGGEQFPSNLLTKIRNISSCKIYNMYGPTETTVWSSIKELTNSENITIGTPISNTSMYVLDNNLNILPVGIPGTLYIGGDGLSEGYLFKDDLTNEKFIQNPYNNSEKIYNTGDLAKWTEKGELICLGRSDFQVKIRGLRIELEEIENAICTFEGIEKSTVTINTDSLNRQVLCGYFISNNRISISELKQYLGMFLPNYMVPTYIMQMDEFKYTPNGKIDKKALPIPNFTTERKYITLPKTETEVKVLKIWEDLLCISPISVSDNFFEIGGDSLLALKMQIELLKENINITYAEIFKYNTIKKLSTLIDKKLLNSETAINIYSDFDYSNINNMLNNNIISNLNNIKYTPLGNVLLTGVTGFLGAHILDYLMKHTNIKVYCLIRKDPSTSLTEKLLNKLHFYFGTIYDELINKRIFIINSDLEQDQLGLSDEKILSLSNKISCVINSAALVKHYGTYEQFESVNVTSVQKLVDFCEKYNKKLIQISTISVSGNTLFDFANDTNKFNADIDFNESNLYIGQSLENVYVRSKFEAEKLILKEISNNKLNALILRIGNITNRFSDGKFQSNSKENAFANRIKAFIEIGSLPDYILDKYIEFSPVDLVAEAIIKSIEYATQDISVLHIYNQNHVYIDNFIKLLPNNFDINIVSEVEFKNIINNILKNNEKKYIISHILGDLNSENKLIYETHIKIKNEFSQKFFKLAGFKWPIINEKYIQNLLNNI